MPYSSNFHFQSITDAISACTPPPMRVVLFFVCLCCVFIFPFWARYVIRVPLPLLLSTGRFDVITQLREGLSGSRLLPPDQLTDENKRQRRFSLAARSPKKRGRRRHGSFVLSHVLMCADKVGRVLNWAFYATRPAHQARRCPTLLALLLQTTTETPG